MLTTSDSSLRSASQLDAALLLDNQLCFAMYSASLAMTKTYKKMLKGLGITYPQYLVLLVLWERDDMMVSELGSRLYLDSGTLTPLLKRLESMGLLHRRRDSADERRVLVQLSVQGRALQVQARAIPPQMACRLPAADEVIALRAGLQQVRELLQAQQ